MLEASSINNSRVSKEPAPNNSQSEHGQLSCRNIWKIMKRLIEEEGYDEDESIDPVNQRKFLLQRMLTHADVMDNTNTDIDHE